VQLSPPDLTAEIVGFLDDFARGARYFNIDSLAAASPAADPLERWNAIVQRILQEDVSPDAQRRVLQRAGAIAGAIGDMVTVIMSGLDKARLTAKTALALPGLQELASRHAVYRILTILEPLKQLLSGLSSDAGTLSKNANAAVPYMPEFLEWVWLERSVVLRKKRWP
jgi:hypothetical protein